MEKSGFAFQHVSVSGWSLITSHNISDYGSGTMCQTSGDLAECLHMPPGSMFFLWLRFWFSRNSGKFDKQ